MRIAKIHPQSDFTLTIHSEDGRVGRFDVRPYLEDEAFRELKSESEFAKLSNGGYFIEWECGADLSADTIEARWKLEDSQVSA